MYQSWEAAFRSDVFANINKVDTNIVAVLVDKDLYTNTNLRNSLERYTTQYIQSKISNSKAVIFPLDTTLVTSRDIAKLLDNLYYGGIEKEPSTLEGVILVGDKIPLPVVNDNGAIFPTIFPYTDFDDPKFYRDPNTQYFLPNGVAKAQPEVRHSIINLEWNVSDYVVYFQKLKSYHQNPNNYVWDRIWYEDFIDQKESYNDLNLVSYMNKFLFAEDLAYHRYNPLLVDLLNMKEDEKTNNLIGWLAWLTWAEGSYANEVGAVFSWLMAEYTATETSSSDQIPTVFVDDALQGFQKSYSDLYGITSTARMRDNILAAGRRDTTEIDNHNKKTEYFDQLYTKELWEAAVPLLVEINKKFEDVLISAVKNNDYSLHIAIPQDAKIEKNIITRTWDESEIINNPLFIQLSQLFGWSNYYDAWIYEAFYYGKNASTITWIDQTTIFVGTPNPLWYNLDNLTLYTWYNQTGSIWVSQGILSQFIEANRWYVVSLWLPDKEFKENNNICDTGLERFDDYVKWYLWWNTPLNITGWVNGLELADKRYDRGGKSNWLLANGWEFEDGLNEQAGEIFNIAWSRRIYDSEDWMIAQTLQWWYLQRVAYQQITRTRPFGWTKRWRQVDPCDLSVIDSEPLQNHNIYSTSNLIQTWYQKTLKIDNTNLLSLAIPCPADPSTWSACFPLADKRKIPTWQFIQKQQVNYKIIDSLSIHNSPNSEQVSQLENTTPSRPIDSVRYISFKGIGGDWVQLPFPNLYSIPVYKQDPNNSNRLVLKSKEELKTTIRDYLYSIVNSYNTILTEQSNKKNIYYASNTDIFNSLAGINNLATPNRNYVLLNNAIFNAIVSDEIIDSLAHVFMIENSLLPYKQKTTNLAEEIDQFYTIANITNKKQTILNEYIVEQSPSSLLTLPDYQTKWYEVISLTSDGDDSISSQKSPTWLLALQSQINEYENYQDWFGGREGEDNELLSSDACSAPYGEPVPLINLSDMSFPWFKVFACWLENIGTPKVTFDFKNAQWPIFASSFFTDFLSEAIWTSNGTETYNLAWPSPVPLTSAQQSLVNNLDVSLSNQSYSLEENIPLDLRPSLLISQKNTVNSLQLRITSTGDTCITINSINTCNSTFQTTITDRHYISPYLVPSQPKAGVSTLIIETCQGTTCAQQTLPLFITPWALTQTSLLVPNTRILAQSQIPIRLEGKDKYNNILSTTLSPLSVEITTGNFIWGTTGFSLLSFREIGQFIAPTTTTDIESDINAYDKDGNLLANKKLSILSWSLAVTSANNYYNTSTKEIIYTLPNRKSQIFLANDNINTGLLPQLSLKLQWSDNNHIAGPVIVQSEQWLFSMYEKKISWSSSIIPFTGLQKTSTLIFNGMDNINIVLQPKLNNNIGSDTLVFQFPDGSQQRIPITIRSADQAARILIEANSTKKLLDNEVTIPLVVQLMDDWGNRSPHNKVVQFDTFGSLDLQWPTTVNIVGGLTQIIVKTDTLGWPWYIRALSNGSGSLIPGLRIGQVKKSIIPKTNINGLYLNLMWASRGNTTDSDSDYFNMVPTILKTSKILSTTTELIAPEAVPTSILMINADWSLNWSQAEQWIITTSGTTILAQNPLTRQQVTLWSVNERSRSSWLLPATETYPEQFSFVPKALWSQWSTNSNKILTLVDTTIRYTPNKNASIEESIAPNNNIGRRNNQQHLIQFWQGKIVGESTLLNASEFLVNYGDPLISRKDKNANLTWTNIDAWPGQLIVSDTTKTVKKAFPLDINNDGLEDIVTVFTDGSVIWSKQYGGKDNIYVEMWPLLQIYGTIKDVFGWDTQGNGFGDIIVQTENDDLRVYTNNLGIFNVDWYPLCIDPDQEDGLPQRVSNIDQWFIEDMDNDGIVDIVLNKQWQISIVYGGSASNWYSYISQNTMRCDPNRERRQENHINIVDHIGVALHTGATLDTSLVRWKGLTTTTVTLDDDGNVEDSTTTNPLIQNQIVSTFTWFSGVLPNMGAFPIDDIVTEASNNLMRWSVSPIDFYPRYETINSENIRYISTSELKSSDQVTVHKSYEDNNGWVLKKWDIVTVKVKISWLRNDPLTYIDRIQWPWGISITDGVISWWNNGTLPSTATYNTINPQWDYYFVVDNITLWSANEVEFSYTLRFQWWAPIKINVSDRNHDTYKDISVYPIDSCAKFLRTYTNTKSLPYSYKRYSKDFIDIGSKLENYHNSSLNNTQNYLSGMSNSIANITWADNQLQDILNNTSSENMSFGNFFNDVIADGWWYESFNLNVTLLGEFDTKVSNAIQNTLDGICSWWPSQDQSCNSGLPVPFNMAFLSPGTFNIMWCKPNVPQIDNIFPEDSWFPIFAFPATLQTPVGPLPLPFPWWWFQQWATDDYGYFWFPSAGWVYPSQIRIYLSPTLTQQMGMAICFGPQTVGNNIPSPFNSIGGNCIVTAVKVPSWSCDIDDESSDNTLSDQDILDLAQFGQCTQTQSNGWSTPWASIPSSPFTMVWINNNGTTTNPFPPGTYFGVVNFEKTPISLSDIDLGDGVVLQWWIDVQPQVQWWWARGMVACIVNDWMDRQTNYIINNLTNMQIWIYLPDLSQLGAWFDTLWQQLGGQDSSDISVIPSTPIVNNPNTFSGNFISQVRNSTIKQSELNNFSTTLNNPFKEIEKLFQQTPLININSQDVIVNIPMIYSEDITRYEAHLKSWIERNKQVSLDWWILIQGVFGICWRNYELGEINSSSVAGNNALDPSAITMLRNQLETTQTSLGNTLAIARSCQSSWWKKEGICEDFMDEYTITSTQQGNDTLLYMEKNLNVTSECLNIVWWDLSTSIANITTITSQSDAFENRIRENIKVLDQYKRFPLQLYQWIHVTDRYLGEISAMVENFLWYINMWLNANATRFEQYVDAIITISTALETRQAILDLSVNWQKKCSTCTVDSYDAYACSLWSLCGQLKLPILRLPPFKIPNIYIDLSHIDLWMDILLPNFQFVPTSVPLIEIPDLPQPPSISVPGDVIGGNIKQLEWIEGILKQFSQLLPTQIPLSVPTIPVLPQPPTLPELPSFIPNITIELPVLPPAPKLPRIAPEIETVINVVSFFSDLYCIVKWGIGLVGENNVKTRIEQLTQRTWEIPLFDNINLTQDMSYQQDKLEWFDFKIDAFVNFTMNFTAVYDLIQGIADQINDYTKKITDRDPNERVQTDKLQEYVNEINNHTQQNIDLTNPFGYNDDNLVALKDEQQTIKQINEYMLNLPQTPQEKKSELYNLIARISTWSDFDPKTDNILQVQDDVITSLSESRKNIQSLSKKVQDYDSFISSLETTTNYKIHNWEQEFGTNLFENISDTQLPDQWLMSDYIVLQKKLLSNYDKGLYQVQNSTNQSDINTIRKEIAYLDKGLSLTETLYADDPTAVQKISSLQREYDSLANLEFNNQAAMCSTLWDMTNQDIWSLVAAQTNYTLNTYPNSLLTAQVGGGSPWNTSSYSSSNLYDFTSYNNKIMVAFPNGTGSRYVDVIQSDYFSNLSQGYQTFDVNNDSEQDIIHRNQSQVWIKYGEQNTSHSSPTLHTHITRHYVAPVWDEINEWEQRSNRNGYLTINGTSFKVYSPDWSVKNLRVRSQDYDSFTISWANSNRQQTVWWYLLELNKLPDTYHLKAHSDLPTSLQSRYVLLLPEENFATNGYLAIYNQLNNKKLESLIDAWVLIDIVPYNTTSNQINYTFTEIERARYYTRIVSIESNGSRNPIYTPSSPRSHHVVAGQQLIADNDGPIPDVRLVREQTNGTIDTGLNPQGIVNTRYRLEINWDDPSWVLENWITTTSWDVLSIQSGATNILSGLYFVANQNIEYRIWAKDSSNNRSNESLILTINVPTIQIEDIIRENTMPGGLSIISSLSRGMDEGLVKFERKRNSIWTTLSNPNVSSDSLYSFAYPLWFDQTVVTGWVYNQTHGIEFFSADNTRIASVDKDNGEITIAPEYISRVQIKPDISSQTLSLILYDTVENRNLFVIKPKTTNTVLQVFSPYSIQSLTGSSYGSFAGGSCIRNPENECIVVVNSAGDIVIPTPYHNTFKATSYNFTDPTTIIGISTQLWAQVWTLRFTATLP